MYGDGLLSRVRDLSIMSQKLILEFRPWDASSWTWGQRLGWVGFVWGGLEVVSYLLDKIPPLFKPKQIQMRGKHLDTPGIWDWGFVTFNKFSTTFFAYHSVRYCWYSPHISWDLRSLNLWNTLGSIIVLYGVYDFFYHCFHRLLHLRSLYWLIHKHHHNQHAPTRGNWDAVNVHPIEFLVGEYLHILALSFVPTHVVTAVVFVMGGGIIASLNHTRHDFGFMGIWEVSAHDQHHVKPDCNYSQYTTVWDRILATYIPHPDKPDASKSK